MHLLMVCWVTEQVEEGVRKPIQEMAAISQVWGDHVQTRVVARGQQAAAEAGTGFSGWLSCCFLSCSLPVAWCIQEPGEWVQPLANLGRDRLGGSSGREEWHSVLGELNFDPGVDSTVGEPLLICSKEIRVEIKLWEFSRNLITKTTEVGKLPKREGVKEGEPRTQDSFWRTNGGAVADGEEEGREDRGEKGTKAGVIRDWGGVGGGAAKEEALSDFRNQEPKEDRDSWRMALMNISLPD